MRFSLVLIDLNVILLYWFVNVLISLIVWISLYIVLFFFKIRLRIDKKIFFFRYFGFWWFFDVDDEEDDREGWDRGFIEGFLVVWWGWYWKNFLCKFWLCCYWIWIWFW